MRGSVSQDSEHEAGLGVRRQLLELGLVDVMEVLDEGVVQAVRLQQEVQHPEVGVGSQRDADLSRHEQAHLSASEPYQLTLTLAPGFLHAPPGLQPFPHRALPA